MLHEPDISWEPCDADRARAALTRLAAVAPHVLANATLADARRARLAFYAAYELLDLAIELDGTAVHVFVLDAATRTWWLDGESTPMHRANADEALELTAATAPAYLRFFLAFLRSNGNAFALAESPDDATADDADALASVRGKIAPLAPAGRDEKGRFLFDATIVHGEALFRSRLAVATTGDVEMLDDEPVGGAPGLRVPGCPVLELPARAGEEEHPARDQATAPADRRRRTAPEEPRPAPTDGPRDRAVTEAVVAVLLGEAIREQRGHTLLQRFNSQSQADDPVGQLARFIHGSFPIVVIESDIPFVEDIVAGLLERAGGGFDDSTVARAGALYGNDLCCAVTLDSSRTRLQLISFHAYRSLWDPDWTAHELAIRNVAVLIGCGRFADVPESLRRVADLRLTLPRIDHTLFERIFTQVFGTPPATGWNAGAVDWTRYLVPADFHAPRRLRLTDAQALAYLQERVTGRLRQVSADTGPALADLHGLGEARQIAEDLIADIQAAQAGSVSWSAVDRGLLLVGPPGTGKTTLAKAIARACGVRFVVASAAQWQSSGHLDAHIRAIRADFGEARRYAPAILFIDEIDSIGSREQLTGNNAVYQTDVINAVLEQVQGFESGEPVVVIAATNYPDKVDPALRRAGRLDQTIHIPLPSAAGLTKIFAYHLEPHRTAGGLAEDVDEAMLGELAFGLTGADVEFFVRGAQRRARKERRSHIAQADLIAEVTRRPRRPDALAPLSADQVRRVAVHEAGHALARLSSSTQGADITFVSVIPRTDGTLGFVATAPREGAILTRRGVMEQLEATLAGRAAEEIVYGAGDIGLGAGGPSESSDLAVATRIATLLICTSGLGGNGNLQWTLTPTPAQLRQVDLLLRSAYRGVRAKLRADRSQLARISDALVARQELSGAEVRQLVEGPPGSAPARSERSLVTTTRRDGTQRHRSLRAEEMPSS